MTLIRQHQQIEILVRLHQRVDHQQSVVGRHIVIHCSVRQQQMPFQVLREILVRLIVVVRRAAGFAFEQPLIPLAPVVKTEDRSGLRFAKSESWVRPAICAILIRASDGPLAPPESHSKRRPYGQRILSPFAPVVLAAGAALFVSSPDLPQTRHRNK